MILHLLRGLVDLRGAVPWLGVRVAAMAYPALVAPAAADLRE